MLDILTFELSGRLALEMTELILGSLEAECEPQCKTRLLMQVHPA